MNVSSAVLGAVLAGGASRRMGADKARIVLAGRRLGARAVEVLRAELDRVVVVSRRPGDHADLGAPEIADRLRDCGPLGGIHAALDHAGGDPVFVLACDLPAVGPALVTYLLGRALPRLTAESSPACVVPTMGDRTQPLCGVYNAACRPLIEEWLAAGERRVLELVDSIAVERVELRPELSFFRADLLDNVNDPETVERFVAGLTVAPE